MNKEDYLQELEQLLLEYKVNNTYTILRDYAAKIDSLSLNKESFNDIVEELGKPEEVVKNYFPNEDNLDYSQEENHTFQEAFSDNQQREQYRASYFEKIRADKQKKHKKQQYTQQNYDNQFKDAGFNNVNAVKTIVIILIAIMLIVLVLKAGAFFLTGSIFGNHFSYSFLGGSIISLLSLVPAILIILIIVMIVNRSNKRK